MSSDRPGAAGTQTLRREAGVFFDQLTPDQEAAAQGILGLLDEIVASDLSQEAAPAAEHGRDHFLPRIDGTRGSRVLMIDGGRGSGKTSLLLTILDALSANWRAGGKIPDKARKWSGEWPRVFDRVVPLQVAELHPLPESANLLLHLAGRLKLVVEAIEGKHEAAAPRDVTAPWHFADDHALPSRKKWTHFFKTVAGGWDGNIGQRSLQLDPEAYALELEDAERRLLEVSATFSGFADALVADLAKYLNLAKDVTPFLLLPVDDADMNPDRSVALLDLLRTLYHRKLVFLVTGHSGLFMRMLRKHYDAALGARPGGNAEKLFSEVEADAFKLAKAVYAKVIPFNQRCKVDRLSHRDRIGLFHQFTDGKSFVVDTIHPLPEPPPDPASLSRPKVNPDPNRHSIRSISPATPTASDHDQKVTVVGSNFQSGLTVTVTFPSGGSSTLSGSQIQSVTPRSFVMVSTLNAPGSWSIRVNAPDGEQSNTFGFTVSSIPPAPPAKDLFTYLDIRPSVGEALPEYLRNLIDLAKFVVEPYRPRPNGDGTPKAPPPLGKDILVRLWRDALETLPFGAEFRSSLARCVRIEEPTGSLVADGTRVRPRPILASRQGANSPPGSAFKSELFVSHEVGHFCDGPLGSGDLELPEPAASAFMLAGWIAYDGRSDQYLKPYDARLGLDYSFVQITYRRENEAPVVFYWYLPDWYTLDYLLFADAWAAYLEGLGASAEATSLDEIAKNFLDIAIAIGEERHHSGVVNPNLTWEDLADRARGLSGEAAEGTQGKRRDLLASWVASRAGLLAAPESGLSADAANEWLSALLSDPADDADAMVRRLREMRRDRARKALIGRAQKDEAKTRARDISELDQRVTALLRDIDESCREFAWASRVEPEGRTLVDFVEASKSITVVHPPASGVIIPERVHGYLLRPSRLGALQNAPASVRQAIGRGLVDAATANPQQPASQILAYAWVSAANAAGRQDLRQVWVPGTASPRSRVDVKQTASAEPVADEVPAVAVYTAPPIELTIDGAPFSPSYLEALYRVRWDVGVDESVDPAVVTGEWKDSWPGLRTWHPAARFLGYWPAVNWPALYDWSCLADHWNSLPAVPRSGSPNRATFKGGDRKVDELAFQFLSAELSIAKSRSVPPVSPSPTASLNWKRLITDIIALATTTNTGPRQSAIADWIKLVPALAAPESCLSPTTAKAILEALTPSVTARALRAARREMAAKAKVPSSEVEEALRAIDRKSPDHPWVQELKRRGRATKPTAK